VIVGLAVSLAPNYIYTGANPTTAKFTTATPAL
jgi:hypothetical protein